ncbi:MAG: sugar phosphate isomerase/epimerase [Planctomycetia bacterium]|nr:sugar phosphate isomerase/epimerase [Planctomycetia bacterium]
MLLGYNTNGLSHHDPSQAIELLASIGYRSVAITIDQHVLNPYAAEFQRQLSTIGRLLQKHQLRSAIETGARYLLDPVVKHEPTLVSPTVEGRARRVEFLKHAVDSAAELGSDCVSLWSGVVHDEAPDEEVFERLIGGLGEVLHYARSKRGGSTQLAGQGIAIGFEPEPGMFIDTVERFAQLDERIEAENLSLTLDVGHLHCQGEVPITDHIRRWGSRLVNVHIEDMRAGVHQHLMFGEGEIDFPPIIGALSEIGYHGGLHVELSRHSHEGPQAARRAFEFLTPLVRKTHA